MSIGSLINEARTDKATAASSRPVSPENEISAAAKWLATGGADRRKAIVPQLQRQFGFTTLQATKVIQQAQLIRARAH